MRKRYTNLGGPRLLKGTLLIAFALVAMWGGSAQAQLAMTRSTFTGTFTNLTSGSGGGTLSTAIGDDVTQDNLPIGFTFNYLGTNYTTMGVSTNGWASFAGTLGGASQNANTNLYNTTGPQLSIGPWWDDLRSDSIVYRTTGTAGSQVFTIQWNALSYFTGSTSRITFQLKLYETTNVIEFHYGTVVAGTFTPASESASIGIEGATGGMGNFLDAVDGSAFVGHYFMEANTKWPVRFYRFTPGAPTAVAGGVYNVGTGQTYPTIDEAVADLNHRGVSGAVTLNLTQSVYDVTPANGDNIFPIIFGPIAGTSIANSVTLTHASSATLNYEGALNGGIANATTTTAFSTTSEPIIGLVGAKFVSISNLNLACSSTGVVDRGVSMINQSGAATAPNFGGTQNCIVANVNVTLNRANTSSMGLEMREATTATAATGNNSSNAYMNFNISNTYFGVLISGSTATFPGTGNMVGNTVATNYNTIGSTTANDIGNGTLTTYGIQCLNQSGINVYNNIIRNVTVNAAVAVDGIFMNATQGTSNVYNNRVSNIRCTSTTSTSNINGIRANVATTAGHSLRVYNNWISGLTSGYTGVGTGTRVIRGIFAQAAGGGLTTSNINIDHNSVSIDGSASPNCSNTCFEIGTASGPVINVRDNIFTNWTGAQTAPALHLAWQSTSATITGNTGSVSNYNDLYVSNTTQGFVGQGNTTQYATLANWQAAMLQDANSVSCDPAFTNTLTDLHASASCVNNVGTPIPWVTVDVDNTTRSVTTPDMGSDEFTPPTLDMSATVLVTPTSGGCYTSTQPVTVRVRNNAVLAINFATNNVVVTVNVTGAVTATINTTLNAGTLAAGATQDVVVGNINMSAAGTYTFNANTNITTNGPDQNLTNDAINAVNISYSPGSNTPVSRSICQGGSIPVSLVNAGATNTGSLQWQSSTDNGATWVNETGPGNTTTNYSVLPTVSTWYRVIMCGSLVTNIDTVTVIPTTPPTVQNDTICGQGTVQLIASGLGTKNWYTASSGGVLVYSGDTLTTYLTATDSFYVSSGSGGGNYSLGLVNNSAGGGQQTSTAYNIFDVTVANATLLGVYVYPGAVGNCLLELRNSAGVLVAGPWTLTATAPDVGQRTYFPINYVLPVGTGFRLAQATGSVSMFRNSAGVTYPYCTPANEVCITNSSAGTTFYYFAYDWQLSIGCSSTRTLAIGVVTPATPIVAAPATLTACEHDSIALSVTSANPSYTWEWNPGLLLTDSTSATPTYVATTTSNFIVTGIDSAGCVAKDTISITVNPAPNNNFWVSDSSTICIGGSVDMAVSNPLDSFYVSHNTPILDSPNPEQFDTLVVAGGPAVLGATGGISRVCINATHTWDGDITIKLYSPTGTALELSSANGGSGDNYTNTCFDMNAPTNITAGTAPFTGSYIPEGAGGFTVFAGQPANGNWRIGIQDFAGGDVGVLIDWYMIFDVPAVSFDWTSSPAGFTSTSDSVTVAPDTTTTYTLTVTDTTTGCEEVYNWTVQVYPELSANISGNTLVCAGNTQTLYANAAGGNGVYTYDWNGLGALDSLTVTVNTDTLFVVNVLDSCSTPMGTDTIWIDIADSLAVVASGDVTICAGTSTTLTVTASGGTGSYTYNWSGGAGTTASVTVSPTTTTTYTVDVSDGCNTVSDNVVVTVTPLPVASFTFAPAAPQVGQTVNFTNTSTNATTYSWTLGSAGTSTLQDPTATFSTVGNQTITLIATNSCGSDTTTQTIGVLAEIDNVLDGGAVLMFPNPNNGVFSVVLSGLSGKEVTVLVTDIRGVELQRSNLVVNGAEFVQPMDLSSFTKGMYFVRVISGASEVTGRITVQ